jgi:hypothetical protein
MDKILGLQFGNIDSSIIILPAQCSKLGMMVSVICFDQDILAGWRLSYHLLTVASTHSTSPIVALTAHINEIMGRLVQMPITLS